MYSDYKEAKNRVDQIRESVIMSIEQDLNDEDFIILKSFDEYSPDILNYEKEYAINDELDEEVVIGKDGSIEDEQKLIDYLETYGYIKIA